MIVGTVIILIAVAIAFHLAWCVHRIRTQYERRLRAIGMEPCDRCGMGLLRRPDAIAKKGPPLCYACYAVVRGAR